MPHDSATFLMITGSPEVDPVFAAPLHAATHARAITSRVIPRRLLQQVRCRHVTGPPGRVEGPDTGREFELPMRGGVVGRGDGCLVQLIDPTVSRQHGMIELRDGALCWVDDSGKARTLINGKPAILHALADGDEIALGATRLVYLP